MPARREKQRRPCGRVIIATALLLVGAMPARASLNPEELACQAQSLSATAAYVQSIFAARQDCFTTYAIPLPGTAGIDCFASVESGTGDAAIDTRLRRARTVLGQKVLSNCLGVVMENLGFPGFCEDTDGPPYTAFDHEICLARAADEAIDRMLGIEHPTAPGELDSREDSCQDLVARKSSKMFVNDFSARATCLKRWFQGLVPAEVVDCLAEDDPLSPGTGDSKTDTNVVSAHNKILRAIPNNCAGIDLSVLGFPHRCTNVAAGSIYPLEALTECMFDTHHGDLSRLLDRASPTTSRCGNGELDYSEQCDDGDIAQGQGDLCLRDCRVNENCGDTDASGAPTISDVLYVMRVSVGLASCSLEVCDVNDDGHITATDALILLRWVVGTQVDLMCPAPISFTCGNGIIDLFEQCDDGDANWQFGDICNASCQRLACGDPNDSGTFTASDAQFIMRAAIGLDTCSLAVCDVNGDSIITTADVLTVLRVATGASIEFVCPFF